MIDIEAWVARGQAAVTEWLDAIASGTATTPTDYNHWLYAFIRQRLYPSARLAEEHAVDGVPRI